MNNTQCIIHYLNICKKNNQLVIELISRINSHGFHLSEANFETVTHILLIFAESDSEIDTLFSKSSNPLVGERTKILLTIFAEKELSQEKEHELYKYGFCYIIHWVIQKNPFNNILAYLKKWTFIKDTLNSHLIQDNLIGKSEIWLKTLERVIEISYFSTAPTLILGDSGTGKELIARLIHTLDPRNKKGELIILDCASIMPELSGSEFFGHVKGAFTNAFISRDGAFAQANNGTLFLDEIGELNPKLQSELLRVLQEKTYKRVGDNMWITTDFRLLSATNRNLSEEVENLNFRNDLYYRVMTFTVTLPPLEKRIEDIPLLTNYFLKKYKKQHTCPKISDAVLSYLLLRKYKGNVRELEHLIQQIAMDHEGDGPITLGNLPLADNPFRNIHSNKWTNDDLRNAVIKAISLGLGLKEIKEMAASIAIDIAVENQHGNLQKAAKLLNVSDRTIQLYNSSNSKRFVQKSDE